MYAVLMETDGDKCESIYYFIRYEGNEDALKALGNELEKIKEQTIFDGVANFDLDLEHLVSDTTAFEMIILELNSKSYHRKFDGKMKVIDFKYKPGKVYDDEGRIIRIDAILGDGRIDRYVADEFIPKSHVTSEDDEISDVSSEEFDSDESDDDLDLDVTKRLKL
jgi:hypothetical protein